MIVLAGDFVSYNWSNLRFIAQELVRLRAPLGVYACLGNHDTFCNRARHITRGLEDAHLTVLSNRTVGVPGHKGAWLVGVDDPCTGKCDFDLALRGVPHQEFRILLAHTPEIADAAADLGFDLALTGHTHGGQINLPLVGPPVVPTRYGPKYAWGLFDHRGTRLVVTRGVGVVEPTVRFRCPPEVVLLTLCREEGELPDGQWGIDGRAMVRRLRTSVSSLRHMLGSSGA
jgi:uncharacterized protein